MMNVINFASLSPLLPIIVVWEIIWKGIALWKSARNQQKVWFVAVLILNTIGILPIVYILFFQKKAKVVKKTVKKKVKRKKKR